MLKGISPLIKLQLLEVLARMGHGDEIVLADAHFPGESVNTGVVRGDGITIADLLEAILPLFELDVYVPAPLTMMAAVKGDLLDPVVEDNYLRAIYKTSPQLAPVERIERFDFYKRVRQAFAIVMTGETAKYGNIIFEERGNANSMTEAKCYDEKI